MTMEPSTSGITKVLRWLWSAILMGGIAACSGNQADDNSNNGGGDADGDADADSDTDSDGDGDSDGDEEYRPCNRNEKLGEIRVAVEVVNEYVKIDGLVASGVDPDDIPLEKEAAGNCLLLGFPDPDEALPHAQGYLDLGTVTIDGLLAPVTMKPNNTNYYIFTGEVPYPGAEEGAEIVLTTADDGEVDPIELGGRGIAPLEVITEQPVLVESGKAVKIKWTPPAQGARSRILIDLNLDNHGAGLNWIECDVPDTGSFEIPAELITAIVDLGLSGWPDLDIRRRTVDSADLEPGCVEFSVFSPLLLTVEVPGLISCNFEHPCPDGMTCQSDLTCG